MPSGTHVPLDDKGNLGGEVGEKIQATSSEKNKEESKAIEGLSLELGKYNWEVKNEKGDIIAEYPKSIKKKDVIKTHQEKLKQLENVKKYKKEQAKINKEKRERQSKTISELKSEKEKNFDLVQNAHQNQKLDFKPMSNEDFSSADTLPIYQSPGYGKKKGSEYRLVMIKGKPAYARQSDHWGKFFTSDFVDGERVDKDHNWTIQGSGGTAWGNKERKSGYIFLEDLPRGKKTRDSAFARDFSPRLSVTEALRRILRPKMGRDTKDQNGQEHDAKGRFGAGGAEASIGAPGKSFADYQKEAGGDHYKAAQAYYKKELKGHPTNTIKALGDKPVHFTGGVDEDKFRKGLDDPVKAESIQHVRDTIENGKHYGPVDSYKRQGGQNDKYSEYHYFQKETPVKGKDGKPLRLMVDVGKTDKGEWEYIAHNFIHSDHPKYSDKINHLRGKGFPAQDSKKNGRGTLCRVEDPCEQNHLPFQKPFASDKIIARPTLAVKQTITIDEALRRIMLPKMVKDAEPKHAPAGSPKGGQFVSQGGGGGGGGENKGSGKYGEIVSKSMPVEQADINSIVKKSKGKLIKNRDNTTTLEIPKGAREETLAPLMQKAEALRNEARGGKFASHVGYIENSISTTAWDEKKKTSLSVQFDEKNRIIGAMSTQVINDSVFINTLGGIGGGKAMMASAIRASKKAGKGGAITLFSDRNPATVGWYMKMGFDTKPNTGGQYWLSPEKAEEFLKKQRG